MDIKSKSYQLSLLPPARFAVVCVHLIKTSVFHTHHLIHQINRRCLIDVQIMPQWHIFRFCHHNIQCKKPQKDLLIGVFRAKNSSTNGRINKNLFSIAGGERSLHSVALHRGSVLQHAWRLLLPLPTRTIRQTLRTPDGALQSSTLQQR